MTNFLTLVFILAIIVAVPTLLAKAMRNHYTNKETGVWWMPYTHWFVYNFLYTQKLGWLILGSGIIISIYIPFIGGFLGTVIGFAGGLLMLFGGLPYVFGLLGGAVFGVFVDNIVYHLPEWYRAWFRNRFGIEFPYLEDKEDENEE
ncbi:hypothetical protein [Listeria phage P100plus]|uniref:Uncharacterized protein n=8 Tax=Pecentumvirus TaxID=1857844 RepID=S4UA17_9CAUD|nr:gp155 [Listeria phage A511]YP_007676814.1 hypothetical protein AG2_148 [Listeria phage vB_LmoM_AG20]YP_008240134.2 hypothetical protein QLX35_gp095 [Listeria phage LP-125]YP_010843705.1 hypothetical protein PI27_gp138 [Listeria phage WIL-1]YP_406463.1 gp87 [Listeria phage P100]QJB22342.1 hypothetical protein [Listeria phage P100plus]QJB22533.1 hypothetical protein [Listeria phage P200]QNL31920.1 hypothetical protein HUK29_0153 [Listeria phage LP-Mix_6.1]QNL32118.1 hypothetical protein HU